MISISEAAKLIAAVPAPLVLLDTCALLDILRSPQRDDDPDIAVRAAFELVTRVNAPRRIWAIGAGIIKIEWSDNATTVRTSLQQHIRQLDHSVRRMSAAVQALRAGTVPTAKGAGELSVVSGMRSEFEPLQIEAQLNSLVGTLLGSVVWLDTDVFEILSAAHRRSASNLRPASKGKRERPDCLIIESYFALCRRLRAEGFFGKAVFVSANKSDFCAEGLPLTFHADLAEPCSECGIEFAINFGHALSILDRA